MSLPGHDDAPVQVDIAIQREMEYKTFLGDYSGSGVNAINKRWQPYAKRHHLSMSSRRLCAVNHFQSLHSYEDFIYNLPSIYPAVITSTLVVVHRSAKQAMIVGEVVFTAAYRLTISEIIDFADGSLIISRYGYEV